MIEPTPAERLIYSLYLAEAGEREPVYYDAAMDALVRVSKAVRVSTNRVREVVQDCAEYERSLAHKHS